MPPFFIHLPSLLGVRLGQSRDHLMVVSLCGFFCKCSKIGENAKLRHPPRRRKKLFEQRYRQRQFFQEQLQRKAEAAARQS